MKKGRYKSIYHYVNMLMVIIVSIIFYKFMDNMNQAYVAFYKKFENIIGVIKPFILGVVIAYLLNPIVNWFEIIVFRRVLKGKIKKTHSRFISTICVFVLIIAVIGVCLVYIVPRIYMNITDLLTKLPEFADTHKDKIMKWAEDVLKEETYNIEDTVEQNINEAFKRIGEIVHSILNNLLTGIIVVTSTTVGLMISLIISFYVLVEKDALLKGLDRLLRSLFKEELIKRLKMLYREVDHTFVKFVVGKSFDSLIIGMIAFVGLSILKSPYSVLISLIVGITNMIPYFGPFIGEVIGVIFVAFYSPIKAMKVLIFLLILQQFDGLYLTPKILGDKMGISPIWIIFSIVIGGSLFGVIGMFLGAPAISVVIMMIRRFIDKRLDNKKFT